MFSVMQNTFSVCPVCLRRIEAQYVADHDLVMLQKTCPEHGLFQTKIWQNAEHFKRLQRTKLNNALPYAVMPVAKGCPYDCGLCQKHKQRSCTVLLEITQRCNMRCAVCFAHGANDFEPDLAVIEQWYLTAQKSNPGVNIQLSGGEPTLREDLPQIIALGREVGIGFIQLNTNGLRLAAEPDLAQKLLKAGLASVFLQFDGTRDAIYQTLRGRSMFEIKRQAIQNCAAAGLGVVLVPTLTPGVNTDDIGKILHFALEQSPAVKGVHFQPISYFGRYPQTPENADRLTLPELMSAIETQTRGLLKAAHFSPPCCEHSLCSIHANYIILNDDKLLSVNRPKGCVEIIDAHAGSAKAVYHTARKWRGGNYDMVAEHAPRCFTAADPQNVDLDEFLTRGKSHSFMVSAMAFQDAWTLDLERLAECCIHIMSPQGRLIPFCAYNLTNSRGEALYRHD